MNPFDICKLINEKTAFEGDEVLGHYNSYLINRVFSNTMDSVIFANEMNRFWGLDKQAQFDFYYYGLPKRKRFGKWHKNQDDEKELGLIQEAFGYSRRKAKDVLLLLRPHLSEIEKELDKGGNHGKKGSR